MDKNLVSNYRGYSIYKDNEGFSVELYSQIITKCGSVWSCMCYIDEMCSK